MKSLGRLVVALFVCWPSLPITLQHWRQQFNDIDNNDNNTTTAIEIELELEIGTIMTKTVATKTTTANTTSSTELETGHRKQHRGLACPILVLPLIFISFLV